MTSRVRARRQNPTLAENRKDGAPAFSSTGTLPERVSAVADADRKRRTAKCGLCHKNRPKVGVLKSVLPTWPWTRGGHHEAECERAAFNAKCLTVLNDVQTTGEPVVVTKRGKPIVKNLPIESRTRTDLFGFMAGKFKIVGASRHRWSPMSPEVH